MKPDTAQALQSEAADYRQRGDELKKRGERLVAHADRIDDLLREDALLQVPLAVNPPVPPASPEVSNVRFRRVEGMMTQSEASQAALRLIGRPAPVEEIADTIVSHGLPVRLSNVDNLRSVMSRGEEFVSKGPGLWWLSGVSLKANPQPDLSAEEFSQNGADRAPETQETGRDVHPVSP